MQVIPILNSVSYPKRTNKTSSPVQFTARRYDGELYSEWFTVHVHAYLDKFKQGYEISEDEFMKRIWAKELKDYKQELVDFKTDSYLKGLFSRLFKKSYSDPSINETLNNRAEEYLKLYRLPVNDTSPVPYEKNVELDFPVGKYSSAKDKELRDWAMTAEIPKTEPEQDNRTATDIFFDGPL